MELLREQLSEHGRLFSSNRQVRTKTHLSSHHSTRSYEPLVGTLDSSLIVKRSQLHETPQSFPPQRTSSLSRPLLPPPSSTALQERFPVPWVDNKPPPFSDSRLREDIRIATKVGTSGKWSHVFVSIRAGWKAFPSYDTPPSFTHEERVKQSTEAVVPLHQRFVENVIRFSTEAAKSGVRAEGETSSPRPPVDGVVPLCDGALVTTCLIPGKLPDLSELYQQRCALCLDSLPQPHQQSNSGEGPALKKAKTDPEMVSHEVNGVEYLLHSPLCSELVTSPELFQAVLNATTASQGSIQIHGTSTAPCELCGRAGGILFQFSRLLLGHPASGVTSSAHAFCLRGLAISDSLLQLDQYRCSLCGQQKGLTFCCSDPTCHRYAHQICALQASWAIGSVIVNNCLQKPPRSSGGGTQQSRPSSCLCFLCHDHSLSRSSSNADASSSIPLSSPTA
jgi:hypothetical protein